MHPRSGGAPVTFRANCATSFTSGENESYLISGHNGTLNTSKPPVNNTYISTRCVVGLMAELQDVLVC